MPRQTVVQHGTGTCSGETSPTEAPWGALSARGSGRVQHGGRHQEDGPRKQKEHGAFGDELKMLAYQKGAPQVKAICEKHGVPYVQENVFIRVKKTVDIMVGNKSMKQWERGD